MSIAEKLQAIAENETNVYKAGVQAVLPKWRKIAEVTLTKSTDKIAITTDAEGKPFKLNKVMLAMALHFTDVAPFFIQLNGCDFMQVKTCANFNTDINRYMNFYAERTGEGAFGYAGMTSVASSLAHTGYGSENETRHASTISGFYDGIDSISLECVSTSIDGIPTVDTQIDAGKTFSYREVSNIEQNGVNIKYTAGYSGYMPYRYNVNMGGISEQGLKLKFDNYTINTTDTSLYGYGQFVIILSGATGTDQTTKLKKFVPFLLFDTNNGTLSLASENDMSWGGYTIHQEIIKSDLLKYENIGGKRFDVVIKDNAASDRLVNRPYNVSVVIEESEEVTGVLDSGKLFALQYHPKVNACYTSIGGLDNRGNNANNWSIDFLGFENQRYGLFAGGGYEVAQGKDVEGCKLTLWGQDI